MQFVTSKSTGTTSRCSLQHQKVPVRRTDTICNTKKYRYDEPMQFVTPKSTGTTSRYNLKHQKVPVRRADTICNTKKYQYDEPMQFATSKSTGTMSRNFLQAKSIGTTRHKKIPVKSTFHSYCSPAKDFAKNCRGVSHTP